MSFAHQPLVNQDDDDEDESFLEQEHGTSAARVLNPVPPVFNPNAGPKPFFTPFTLIFAVAVGIFCLVAIIVSAVQVLPLWTPLGIFLSCLPGIGNILLVWGAFGVFRQANFHRILIWFTVGVFSVILVFIVELVIIVGVAIFMLFLTEALGVQESFLYFLGAADQEGDPLPPPSASFLPIYFLFSFLMAANAAIVEELNKYLIVMLIGRFHVNPQLSPMTHPAALVIYGVAAVAGFATTENIEYDTNQTLLATVLIPTFRSLMPVHYFTVIIMAARVASNSFSLTSYNNFFHVMWLPVLLHFTYDFTLFALQGILSVTGIPEWVQYVALVGAILIVAAVLLTGLIMSIISGLKLWRRARSRDPDDV